MSNSNSYDLLIEAISELNQNKLDKAISLNLNLNARIFENKSTALLTLFNQEVSKHKFFFKYKEFDLQKITPIAIKLLQNGADPTLTCSKSENFLHKICKNSCIINEQLINDIFCLLPVKIFNSQTIAKKSPLIFIALNQSAESINILQNLLKFNIDLDLVDNTGSCALHYACYEPAKIITLLKANSNPNILDKNGMSPLFKAVLVNRLTSAKMLIDFNADPLILDKKNRLAHSLATGKASDYVKACYEKKLFMQSMNNPIIKKNKTL